MKPGRTAKLQPMPDLLKLIRTKPRFKDFLNLKPFISYSLDKGSVGGLGGFDSFMVF